MSRRTLPGRIADLEPWSFQTHFALKHWFDPNSVPEICNAPRLNPTDALRITQAFGNGVGLVPGATVGRLDGTLWATCDIFPHERTIGFAGRLRDALGLFDRPATDFAFLVKLGKTMTSVAPLHAPTAFDAGGYPRFRPWPPQNVQLDADTGRTYDLNDRERAAAKITHGRQEMVLKPRALAACEQLIPLGHIGWDADRTPSAFEAYADEASFPETARLLAERLDAL